MSDSPLRVVITGAAGQIAYSLIYQVASGYVFGNNQPLILHLLDIAPMMGVLEGVVMELQDCALPLLVDVKAFCEEDKVGRCCRESKERLLKRVTVIVIPLICE